MQLWLPKTRGEVIAGNTICNNSIVEVFCPQRYKKQRRASLFSRRVERNPCRDRQKRPRRAYSSAYETAAVPFLLLQVRAAVHSIIPDFFVPKTDGSGVPTELGIPYFGQEGSRLTVILTLSMGYTRAYLVGFTVGSEVFLAVLTTNKCLTQLLNIVGFIHNFARNYSSTTYSQILNACRLMYIHVKNKTRTAVRSIIWQNLSLAR